MSGFDNENRFGWDKGNPPEFITPEQLAELKKGHAKAMAPTVTTDAPLKVTAGKKTITVHTHKE